MARTIAAIGVFSDFRRNLSV